MLIKKFLDGIVTNLRHLYLPIYFPVAAAALGLEPLTLE
jgi:hypothetical protein